MEKSQEGQSVLSRHKEELTSTHPGRVDVGRSCFRGQRAWTPQEKVRSTPAGDVQSQSISHTGGSGPSLELSPACLFTFMYSPSCHWAPV